MPLKDPHPEAPLLEGGQPQEDLAPVQDLLAPALAPAPAPALAQAPALALALALAPEGQALGPLQEEWQAQLSLVLKPALPL